MQLVALRCGVNHAVVVKVEPGSTADTAGINVVGLYKLNPVDP
jgi:hypothetical protein